MEKQRIDITTDAFINLQPYFNQVVSSNLVNAFFTAKQAHPEKTEKEIIKLVMDLFTIIWGVFDKLPVRTYPPKESEEKESKK